MKIPNVNDGKIVDENGYPTSSESLFRQQLIRELKRNVGTQGFVFSPRTAAEIASQEANQDENGNYTCRFGTAVWDTTNNRAMIAVDSGGGVPQFKEIQLV